ncbi:hypothetical protein MMC30_003805 [Trapelia coarctata]|nr:hypothetical protein [Trapelia coarctata]
MRSMTYLLPLLLMGVSSLTIPSTQEHGKLTVRINDADEAVSNKWQEPDRRKAAPPPAAKRGDADDVVSNIGSAPPVAERGDAIKAVSNL